MLYAAVGRLSIPADFDLVHHVQLILSTKIQACKVYWPYTRVNCHENIIRVSFNMFRRPIAESGRVKFEFEVVPLPRASHRLLTSWLITQGKSLNTEDTPMRVG